MIRARRSFLVVGPAVLVAALVFALDFTGSDPVVARAQSGADASDGIAVARQLSAVFEHVAETAQPFVVSVVSTGRVAMADMQSPFGERFPFEDFFGRDFFDRLRPPSGGEAPLRRGQGSGVIVSDDGYILTNHHVVAGAEAVTVRLFDDREFEAEIVGTDPKTDLAVLRIDAGSLTPARLGNSDELKVGEWVVAAGNPFGLTASVTAGIVSALGRSNMGITDYEDFIQTDAAINPGNSGGPLLDLDGNVVGINTAIMTRTGTSMGVGFAIPSNMAQHIMQSLIETGHVVRGWLGVGIQRLDPELARSFGYEGEGGVLVSDVQDDTPASRAGLQSGDIVTAYDGRPVSTMERFRADVAATQPGTEIPIEVFRDGDTKTLRVKIGELEETMRLAGDRPEQGLALGLTVQEITPALARDLDLDAEVEGVVVTRVEPMSAAARAGIRRGDVIEDVQGHHVASIADFREGLREKGERGNVRLAILRGGMRVYVVLNAVAG